VVYLEPVVQFTLLFLWLVIISTSLDKLITKWDPATGKKVFDFKDGSYQRIVRRGQYPPRSVDNSGPFLDILAYRDYLYALSSDSREVLKFQVNTGECISAFGELGSSILPSRPKIYIFKGYVVVGDKSNQITFFDTSTETVAFTMWPSLNNNRANLYTISGDYMYACYGAIINKYHINQKTHSICFEGHTDSILSLVVSGSFLFTSSRDNTMKKWDINTGANLATISGHLNHVTCLQVYGGFLYSGSSDCVIKKWNFGFG
jgi:WD40 repeat protein